MLPDTDDKQSLFVTADKLHASQTFKMPDLAEHAGLSDSLTNSCHNMKSRCCKLCTGAEIACCLQVVRMLQVWTGNE